MRETSKETNKGCAAKSPEINRVSRQIHLVESLLKRKNYGDALEKLEQILKYNPEAPKGNYLMGVALSRTCSYELSANYLLFCLEENESDPKALQEMAFVYYKLEDTETSLEYCHKCLRVDPRNLEVRHLMAKIHEKEDNLSEAEFQYKECLILFPLDEKTFKLSEKLTKKIKKRESKKESKSLEKIEELHKNFEIVKQITIQREKIFEKEKEERKEREKERDEKLKKEIEEEKRKLKEEQSRLITEKQEEGKMCVICLTKKANMANRTCGHICICPDCIRQNKMDTCPICKQKSKSGYMKVYF